MIPVSSRASLLLNVALVLSAATASPRLHAAPPASAPVLTVAPGPRGAAWKRVFNPFLYESDTRWPATAGVYEPLLVYSRATGATCPGWPRRTSGARATPASASHPFRCLVVRRQPFTRRDVVFTFDLMRRFPALDRQVWGFLADVKTAAATSVEFTFKRAVTPALLAIGHAAHRCRAQVEGRGPARRLRRSEPGGHGALRRGAPLRARRYELGRNPKYWQKGKPCVAALRVTALPEQRRDHAGAGGGRAGLGVAVRRGHREALGGEGPGPPALLVSRLRTDRADATSTRAGSRSTTRRCARPQPGPRPAADHARGDERLHPPADATGLAASQKPMEGRGRCAERRAGRARRGPGQQAPGRGGARPGRRAARAPRPAAGR